MDLADVEYLRGGLQGEMKYNELNKKDGGDTT